MNWRASATCNNSGAEPRKATAVLAASPLATDRADRDSNWRAHEAIVQPARKPPRHSLAESTKSGKFMEYVAAPELNVPYKTLF